MSFELEGIRLNLSADPQGEELDLSDFLKRLSPKNLEYIEDVSTGKFKQSMFYFLKVEGLKSLFLISESEREISLQARDISDGDIEKISVCLFNVIRLLRENTENLASLEARGEFSFNSDFLSKETIFKLSSEEDLDELSKNLEIPLEFSGVRINMGEPNFGTIIIDTSEKKNVYANRVMWMKIAIGDTDEKKRAEKYDIVLEWDESEHWLKDMFDEIKVETRKILEGIEAL